MAEIPNKLVEEIQNILEKEAQGWDIKRYSDKEHFESLWEINNGKKTINGPTVIIWDGLPPNEGEASNLVPIYKFITPIDWALAYSVRHKNNKPVEGNENDKLCIVIFDIYSHCLSDDKEIMDFHKPSLEGMKDWVKFYSFNVKNFPDIAKSPISILDDLQTSKDNISNCFKNRKERIIELSNKGKDHHSINNILGAVLLKVKTLPDTIYEDMQNNGNASLHRKAFIQSFKDHIATEQRTPAETEESNTENLSILPSGEGAFQETKIILTDDHAEYDWVELLCGWIHGRCPTTTSEASEDGKDYYKIHKKDNENLLYSAASKSDYGYASLLINKLKAIINQRDTNDEKLNSERFRLSFIEDEDKKDELLIFDLYLFPDQPEEERKYLKAVLDLALELYRITPNSPPTILSEDRESHTLLESNQDLNSRQKLSLLTLLPRIIASLDPSFPIIVLSSTRADNMNPLIGAYKNIFVVKKPRFSDDFPVSPDQTKNDFEEELEKAAKFIKVRQRLRILSENALSNIKKLPDPLINHPLFTASHTDGLCVQLHLDETKVAAKSQNFTLGGVCIVGPNDDDIWNELEQNLTCDEEKRIRDLIQDHKNNGKCPFNPKSRNYKLLKEKKYEEFLKINMSVYMHGSQANKQKARSQYYDAFKDYCLNNNGNNNFYVRATRLTSGMHPKYNRLSEAEQVVMSAFVHTNILEVLAEKLFIGIMLPLLSRETENRIKKVRIRYGTIVRYVSNANVAAEDLGGYKIHPNTGRVYINRVMLDPNKIQKLCNEAIETPVDVKCKCVETDDFIFNKLQYIADAILSNLTEEFVIDLHKYPSIQDSISWDKNNLRKSGDLQGFINVMNAKPDVALSTLINNEEWKNVEKVIKEDEQQRLNESINNKARSYICTMFGEKTRKIKKHDLYKIVE